MANPFLIQAGLTAGSFLVDRLLGDPELPVVSTPDLVTPTAAAASQRRESLREDTSRALETLDDQAAARGLSSTAQTSRREQVLRRGGDTAAQLDALAVDRIQEAINQQKQLEAQAQNQMALNRFNREQQRQQFFRDAVAQGLEATSTLLVPATPETKAVDSVADVDIDTTARVGVANTSKPKTTPGLVKPESPEPFPFQSMIVDPVQYEQLPIGFPQPYARRGLRHNSSNFLDYDKFDGGTFNPFQPEDDFFNPFFPVEKIEIK